MSDKAKELELDIAEVKELALKAQRPRIQTLLGEHLSVLKTELELMKHSEPVLVKDESAVSSVSKAAKSVTYTPLNKYSWDQEGNKVKIYFSLENVGNECKTEQINVHFGKSSVEMTLLGFKKLNYIFAIKKLAGEIEPETCKYFVKTNMISLTLIKKDKKHWDQIYYKEDKFKTKDESPAKEDPQASLMNMMKKMYEEGDQKTKASIAEAWTKANDKKKQDPAHSAKGEKGEGGFKGEGFDWKSLEGMKL